MKIKGLCVLLFTGLTHFAVGQSYHYIQIAKLNDTTFAFTLHSTLENMVDSAKKNRQDVCPNSFSDKYRTDTIRFFNPSNNQLYSFPCNHLIVIDSFLYTNTFYLNTTLPEYAFFKNADSLYVFIQTFNCNHSTVINCGDWIGCNFSSDYNFNTRNNITVALFFPKNYNKLTNSKGTKITENFNNHNFGHLIDVNRKARKQFFLFYYKDIFYSPSYDNLDGDSIHFSLVYPFDSLFINFNFAEKIYSFNNNYGRFHPRFGLNRHFYLNCPGNMPSCNFRMIDNEIQGQHFNPRTGEFIAGFKDTFNNNAPNFLRTMLFKKLTTFYRWKDTTLKLNEVYFSHSISSSLNRNYLHPRSPRIEAPYFEYTACANDTLVIPILPSEVRLRNNTFIVSKINWDIGISSAQWQILPHFNRGNQARFTWIMDSSHIRWQPHRFHAYTHIDLDNTDFPQGTTWQDDIVAPNLNGRAFLIKVIAPIRSRTIIDSVQCGRVYVHAEDTLPTEVRFTHRWQLLTLDKDSSVATAWGRNSAIQAPKGGRYLLELMVISEQNTCPYIQYDTVDIPDFLRLEMEDFDICKGRDLFYATNVKNAQGNIDYQWSYLNQISTLPIAVRAAVDNSFQVFLSVTDTLGCTATDSTLIKVLTLP